MGTDVARRYHASVHVNRGAGSALCNSALLFLGFHLQDWEFRTLLRCIDMVLQGSELQSMKTHGAVQIPPGGDPDKQAQAQSALQNFFKHTNIRLSIYYGTVQEFSSELKRQYIRWEGGAR